MLPAMTDAVDPVLHEDDAEVSLQFETGTVQSRMLRADPSALVLEYTRLMMGFLLLRPEPSRIAMIGLGGGSLVRYCARRLPAADLTAIEISPEVIAFRDAFDLPPDGPRFRVVCKDGAAFVRADGDPFDVLLVDGFDRGGQPEQLCTPAFYDDCHDRLSPGGVLAVNLHSDDDACDARIDRVRDSFGGRVVVVAADGSANRIVFAGTDAAFPPHFAELVARLRALDALHPVRLDVTLRKILAYVPPRHRAPKGRKRRARA
jgi:spermidine synthase